MVRSFHFSFRPPPKAFFQKGQSGKMQSTSNLAAVGGGRERKLHALRGFSSSYAGRVSYRFHHPSVVALVIISLLVDLPPRFTASCLRDEFPITLA